MGRFPFVWVVMVSNVSMKSMVEVVMSFEVVMEVSVVAFPVSMVVFPSSVAVPGRVVTIVVSVVEVSVSMEVVIMGVPVMMALVSVVTLPSVMRLFSAESNTVLLVFVESTVADGAVKFVVELGSVVWNFPRMSIMLWPVAVVFTLILMVRVLCMVAIYMVATVPFAAIEVNIVKVLICNAIFFAVAAMMRLNWVSFVLLFSFLFR